MEKPLFPGRKTFSKSPPRSRSICFDTYQKTMVFDFSKTCKTYKAKSYKKDDFAGTRCPVCNAVGRFKLHGSYHRYVVYFDEFRLFYELFEIKRIKCISCKTTHAVMPGDIIPYMLLTLFVLLFILRLFYLEAKPVLNIAEVWGFSFQFIYSALYVFRKHAPRIYQYFREVSPRDVPTVADDAGIISLIRKPFMQFQSGYLELNKRTCFMCKFFNSANGPRTGRLHILLPSGGQQHNP